MASAGRILIMPKGNYDPTASYENLDLVFHGGTSWIAKKTVTGIEPAETNSEYWFKLCESFDATEIYSRLAALENQMLSTASLDDIDLSGYALKSDLNTTNTTVEGMKSDVNTLKSDVSTVKTNVSTLTTKASNLETNVSGLGTTVSNLQTKLNSLPTSANTEIVSYSGKGTSGSANPCSITFSKIIPKVLICIGWMQSNGHQVSMGTTGYRYTQPYLLCITLTTAFSRENGFLLCDSSEMPSRYAKKSEDGKTISWYVDTASNPQAQLNLSGYTYYILGIA